MSVDVHKIIFCFEIYKNESIDVLLVFFGKLIAGEMCVSLVGYCRVVGCLYRGIVASALYLPMYIYK